jgi:predicted nucleic acid-binding protein
MRTRAGLLLVTAAAALLAFVRPVGTAVLDYVCAVARHQDIFFLWRPFLRDPGDDLVLEVAVAGSCDHIVTFNLRDFKDIERFGVTCLTPINFLRRIGDFP